MKIKKYIFIIPIATITIISLLAFSNDNRKYQLSKQISIFNAIIKELDLFYVDTIQPKKMIGKGIDAMLRNLDPYTEYYPEDEADDLKMLTTGKYAGIGSVIRFHKEKNTTVIADPYEGLPAAKGGLKIGDCILSIDGTDIHGMPIDSVSNMLRGTAGTTLTLEIERPGEKNKRTVKLIRESITMPAISYYGIQNNNIGYIQLESFTENCARNMRHALIELKKQGAKAFIIDLRGNGGGLLNEAVEIVNLFVPKGLTIVTTKGKIKQANNTYTTSKEPFDTESPLAVLVDGHSASAAEIVAGSLQDLDRAIIIGSRTYGKGLVQTTRQLPGGGYLKVTTSKYYIPSGRCIQALDYSHLLEDGRSTRIADSLTTIFHTAAGREVRDGGGIRPDVEPKGEELSTLLFYLLQEMAVFDYATNYRLKHDTIAPAEQFTMSDEEYEDFKKYLKSTNFSYDVESLKILDQLKKIIKFEGYEKITEEEIASLEKKLQADLDYSLDHFNKNIKEIIADEIVLRYHGRKGGIVYSLREDSDIKEANRLLNDKEEYTKILTPDKK
ncbi:MAG: S41 family peptidase [Bacteroidaceae bacterium]|nr:S41 family peptidase [Bacteroidaceae bacterium]